MILTENLLPKWGYRNMGKGWIGDEAVILQLVSKALPFPYFSLPVVISVQKPVLVLICKLLTCKLFHYRRVKDTSKKKCATPRLTLGYSVNDIANVRDQHDV